jgi:hypothetical protein
MYNKNMVFTLPQHGHTCRWADSRCFHKYVLVP